MASSPIVTECDVKREQLVRERFGAFIECLEINLRLIGNLLEIEQPNSEQIWKQSYRYELLARSCPDAAPYPEDLVEQVKTECVQKIVRRLKATGILVADAVNSYNRILESFQRLEKAAYRLDWMQKSELVEGSKKHSTLDVFLYQGYSICNQLEEMTKEFQKRFNGIDACQAKTIDQFRNCLIIPEKFEAYVDKFVAGARIMLEGVQNQTA